MIRFGVLISIYLFGICGFAQDTIIETNYCDFGKWDDENYYFKTDTAFVFTDQSNVRKSPSIQSEISTTLPIGTRVKILERTTEYFTLNGIRSNWLKVQANDTLIGFVWGGVLCMDYLEMPENKRLFWGVTYFTSSDTSLVCKIALRLVQNNQLVSEISFRPKHADQPKVGMLKRMDHPLLDGIQSIVVFETLAEACGVYSSETNFLFDGMHFHYVGGGFSMGDGGVMFENTTLRFPFENSNSRQDYHFLPNQNRYLKIVSEGHYNDSCVWVETTEVHNFEWKQGVFEPVCEE